MVKKLDKWVHVKVTDQERGRWQKMAASQGVTLADLIRSSLTSAQVGISPKRQRRVHTPADPALIAAIAKAGNNLNQLARWANTYKSGADSVQVLSALAVLDRHLSFFLPPGGVGGEAPGRQE